MRFLLVVLLAGCGFHTSECHDGGSGGGGDGGGGDLGVSNDGDGGTDSSDLGGSDLSSGGGGRVGTCPTPALFVLVQSNNGATQTGGRILQLTIHSDGSVAKCGNDLTANGTLPSQVTAIGWIPPNLVGGVGTNGKLIALDPTTDNYHWSYTPPCCAGDGPICSVFPIRRSDGKTQVAAAWGCGGTGAPDLTGIDVFDNAKGTLIEGWKLNDSTSPILLGLSVLAMTQSPLDPTHLFYSTESSASKPGAAIDIPLPVDGGTVQGTVYQNMLPTNGLNWIIHAIPSSNGGGMRTAWVQHGFSPSQDELYFVNDTGGGPQLTGPLHCKNLGTAAGQVNCASPMVFNDVMPDPSNGTKLFATCTGAASNTGHVVRIDSSSMCELIVDGSKLAVQTYPAAFALAQ